MQRRDGAVKVTGTARYAYEADVPGPAYCHPLQSTIARGRITSIDASAAERVEGVLKVITHATAECLATKDGDLAILQSPGVAYRGQLIGAVVAETSEIARQAASLVRIDYDVHEHDARLSVDHPGLYKPETVTPGFATDTDEGDVDAAMAEAQHTVDQTYTTAMYHNNPMEPHATTALWEGGELTLWESTQGVFPARQIVCNAFGLDPERVRVICPYVGGGFGSKGLPHSNTVLAVLAARALPGRPVKLALTRQQMFALVGYRTPTIQRVRLAADHNGRLSALAMDVVEQTSRIKEFAEQTAVISRVMYATPNRRTSHRLAALDVPVPSWMRAPGECPGMFGPEVALDELAERLGLDPIELRVINEPERDPETGKPFSSRNLVACLREGARRFGWADRDPRPGVRREGRWLVGSGVASSVYPTYRAGQSTAVIRHQRGHYTVEIGAADLGTGAATAIAQLTAEQLGVPEEDVEARIGDTALPFATLAGGSAGTATWGSAIVSAAERFRDKFGAEPPDGAEVDGSVEENPDAGKYSMYAFGAQFAEAQVNTDTGEIRVPRLLGVFGAGRIVNARTARSQFLGGMTMGLSMALHEQSLLDPRFGHVVNHDFADYHIATCADATGIEAHWIDEEDPYVNPLGVKGIGELGIVGTAAAVANAVYHATGVRVRDLPITLDKLLSG
jgi:xanthine dehydrogenase YagR molybdenum-binding subunit